MKQYERKIIKADGAVVDYPPQGRGYTLEELQKAVGGYFELVHVGSHLMVVNEEGKPKGLPFNLLASELYGNPDDLIVGDVLVCRDKDISPT